MKVLVTGAAGFIGSNLVRYLLEVRPNWKITALDSLTYAGNLENIADLIEGGRVAFAKIDITNQVEIDKLFSEGAFEMVFHLAAETHVDRSLYDPLAFVRTNVEGTQILLNASRATGVKRYLQISTDEVYGSLGPTGKFLETTPLDPSSPYSASKAGSDLLVLASARTYGMNCLVSRCSNNYGPYQFPEKLIPLFIANALEDKSLPVYGDGLNVRSWLHVVDHCRALLLIAEKGRQGEVYNVGGSDEAEIPNIVVTKEILKALGKPETLIKYVTDRPGHDRRYAIDYTKINEELGWKPQVSFVEGLKETVKWYVENRAWWERIRSGEYMDFYAKNYGGRIK